MLSNIGRAAIRRAGPGANASSTKRVLQSGWHLQRFDASKNTESSAVQNQLVFLKRQYATATKATQTTKPRTKTAAKPGAKPKSKLNKAPKAPTKKKALKKKVVKKVAKKKVAKKVIKKKVLTPEQQTRQKIKQLKKVALSPPTRKAQSAWMVFLEEARASPAGETPQAVMKSASARYKSLPAEELQEYNHKAGQNKVANNIAYKQWIANHTPDEIRLANNARLALKKTTAKQSPPPLIDERIPKKARSAWTFYFMERHAAGDFKHIKASEAMQLAAQEYSSLSAAEKQKYLDQHSADVNRYNAEFRTVFKRETPSAAAAAKA